MEITAKQKKAILNKRWREENRERYNAMKMLYRDRTKKKTLLEYSHNGKIECKYCGITDIDVLVLDHIEDNGAEHRKQIGISGRSSAGTGTYEALKREGYPKGLQVLCANCNTKKQRLRIEAKRSKNKYYNYYFRKEVQKCQT